MLKFDTLPAVSDAGLTRESTFSCFGQLIAVISAASTRSMIPIRNS
jgi:hypothetical protein